MEGSHDPEIAKSTIIHAEDPGSIHYLEVPYNFLFHARSDYALGNGVRSFRTFE